jgi:hypothetical protein
MRKDSITQIIAPGNLHDPKRERTTLNYNDRAKVERAAEIILLSLCWRQSAEGTAFWNSVADRLRGLAEGEFLE